MDFTCGSVGKESTCSARDLGSNPGLGRSSGEGKGYPLQYSGLENSKEFIVQWVAKSQTRLSNFHFHVYIYIYIYIYIYTHTHTHTDTGNCKNSSGRKLAQFPPMVPFNTTIVQYQKQKPGVSTVCIVRWYG